MSSAAAAVVSDCVVGGGGENKNANINYNLYTNTVNIGTYKYPREWQTDVKFERRTIIMNSEAYAITITGIPDGVSPIANEAIVHPKSLMRLYIFSDKALSEENLQSIDTLYGRKPYPIVFTQVVRQRLETYPSNNFYMCKGSQSSSISEYVEYRYLQMRHQISTIAYESNTGIITQMVLPKRPMLVIIMPDNFIRNSLRSGYFRFDNNIIVRVFSKYLLASSQIDTQDDGSVTVFTTSNEKITNIVENFFGRLGIHRITSNSPNHIYGYDKYITLVVGSVANIAL